MINNHPIVFPFKTQKRNTTSGKITRDHDPITVLWDDGTVMEMIFSGTGVERPSKGDRTPNNPYRQYPKQLTSADGVVLNWGHISEEWDYHLLTKLQCQI